jgi:hypothetical protein
MIVNVQVSDGQRMHKGDEPGVRARAHQVPGQHAVPATAMYA